MPVLCLGLLIASRYQRQRSLLEAVVVGALGWGLAGVTSLELLGLVGEINRLSILVFWSLVAIGAIFYLITQQKNNFIEFIRDGAGRDAHFRLQAGDSLYFSLAVSTAIIAAVTVTIAVVAVPNNRDSLSYHLPRIEQWIQQGSLAHFPTTNIRQLASNPLAEMLILHFRILAESDRLDNLVQTLAFLGSIAASALVARRLGASRNGEILAAFYTATLPMAILQGSSTQNDLVVSFFLLAAYERLLAWRSSGRFVDSLGIGAAAGIAILTKGTAYFFAAPLFLFALAIIVRTHPAQIRTGLVMIAMVLAINAGHYYRNIFQFGTPLGPQYGVASLDHRPGAIFSTAVRNIASNLATPSYRLNQKLVTVVSSVHSAFGLKLDNPNTTFPSTHLNLSDHVTFEDSAPNPLHLALIIFTILLLTFEITSISGGSGQGRVLEAYSATVVSGGILFCIMLRWQPWITRLQLPFFVLMGPAIATVLTARISRKLIIVIAACLVLGALPCLLLNQKRPVLEELPSLISHRYRWFASVPNVFTGNIWQQMFENNMQTYRAYREAVTSINNRTFGGVGVIVGNDWDVWEYPLWRMLHENQSTRRVRLEHVCLPDSGSPRSTFQPETVLAIRRYQPAILICPNGVFEKEASFTLGEYAPDSNIAVYHRLPAGVVAPE